MVLFYSGGDQRPIWTQERAQPYITYVDEQNTSHWFFDSFLMLEILNTSDNWQTVREYTKGMRYESATKAEWMKLIDCYFNSEGSSSNLVVISFLFHRSSSFLILLKVVDMFAF